MCNCVYPVMERVCSQRAHTPLLSRSLMSTLPTELIGSTRDCHHQGHGVVTHSYFEGELGSRSPKLGLDGLRTVLRGQASAVLLSRDTTPSKCYHLC